MFFTSISGFCFHYLNQLNIKTPPTIANATAKIMAKIAKVIFWSKEASPLLTFCYKIKPGIVHNKAIININILPAFNILVPFLKGTIKNIIL